MSDHALDYLSFKNDSPLVQFSTKCFRPPSWPPPDDWVVSIDRNGNDKSKYGDDVWDFTDIERRTKCNFNIEGLDSSNKALLKLTLLFLAYRPKAPRALKSTFSGSSFSNLKKFFCLCSEQGIAAEQASKFPKVIEAYSQIIAPSSYTLAISTFHTLLLHNDKIGFTLLTEAAIAQLASLEPKRVERVQTPYIPPRIWSYQISRLNEFLDDFIIHQVSIVRLFELAAEGHKQNTDKGFAHVSPFFDDENRYRHRTYFGTFRDNLIKFNLLKLFDKWIKPSARRNFTIEDLSVFLNLAKIASFTYLINFSLQRKSEALDLRTDCLKWEDDANLGRVGFLIGETTKTNTDADARWVVPPHVEKAFNVAKLVSNLRQRYCNSSSPEDINTSPFLFQNNNEPWSSGIKNSLYPSIHKLMDLVNQPATKLFDPEQLRITEDDWKIALALTPNLQSRKGFESGVGSVWQLSYHQFRRTTNVNMFTSGLISDVSMQWQMKHSTRIMPLYYARNYTNLRLNQSTENFVIKELYQSIYRDIVSVVRNTQNQYIVPHGIKTIESQVVNLVLHDEEKKLSKIIQKGSAGCRKTLLGFCMSSGACEYGGIESISKCTGGKSGKICHEAIFDKNNEKALLDLKKEHESELASVDDSSPRYKAVKEEVYAIEVFLNVISSK